MNKIIMTLAIKGHPTRGREVIQLLEMLGGRNVSPFLKGDALHQFYHIRESNNEIICFTYSTYKDGYKVFTLEEFEDKFPYKVGDKVSSKYLKNYKIEKIEWEDTNNRVIYKLQGMGWYSADELQPYKEENYCQVIGNDTSSNGVNTSASSIIEETMEGVYAYNEINCYHQDFGDKVRIRLGNDFEIKVEDKITYIVKKKPQYPKTLKKLPKFKVGDRIILKDNPFNMPSIKITAVTKSQYILENEGFFYIGSADEKYVLEDKFDISTLKPFDKVLVRDNNEQLWVADLFGFHDDRMVYKFMCVGHNVNQCIPYNDDTKHLLGTTDDCDEFYKTWE